MINNIPEYLRIKSIRRYACGLILFLMTILRPVWLSAQDIGIRNPSLEGVPAQYRAPGQWLVVTSTPDIQPGITGVYGPPSDGSTYVGFRGGRNWLEAIAQKLNRNMRAGTTYRISMDLSFARGYDSATCYGALAIYGGVILTDTLELLWQSGAFVNTQWKRFTAEFTPHGDYPYLVLGGDVRIACNNAYGIALALDNLDDTLREVPVVTHEIEPSCQGMSNGRIMATASGRYAPFTYDWEPTGTTGNILDGVPGGTYFLNTHATNGVIVRDTIVLPEAMFDGHATVVPSGCAGEAQNKIILNTTGGIAPYEYSISGTPGVRLSPEFDKLYAGDYNIVIKDAKGCMDTLENIYVPEPPPFNLDARRVQGMSCAGANDAEIIFTVSGGIPPYTYAIPGLVTQADSVIRNLSGATYAYNIADAQDCNLAGNIEVPLATHSCAVYAPNAFSPDGDGLNDVFRVKIFDKISDFRMFIYDRWGQLIYTDSDMKGGWKGDFKGQLMPAGTYLWMIMYTDGKQQARKQTGSITIVR